MLAGKKTFSDKRGPFPLVDENISLLRELKPRDIFYTRNRVRDWAHPKWRIAGFAKKKMLSQYLARKRANDLASKQIVEKIVETIDPKKKK